MRINLMRLLIILIISPFLFLFSGCNQHVEQEQKVEQLPENQNAIAKDQIDKDASKPPPLFNSINDLSPLNVSSEQIIDVLSKNGYTKENFHDHSIRKFKSFGISEQTIWLSPKANIGFGSNDNENNTVRTIRFYFDDLDSLNQYKKIISEMILLIDPIASDSPGEIQILLDTLESSSQQYAETSTNKFIIRIEKISSSYIIGIVKLKNKK